MAEQEFFGQSANWARYRIVSEGEKAPHEFKGVSLSQSISGNLTELHVGSAGSGAWSGVYVDHEGKEAEVSKHSKNEVVIALANRGNWSGGGTYRGYIFGKPGAIVRLVSGSRQKWLVFEEGGSHEQDTNPGVTAKAL